MNSPFSFVGGGSGLPNPNTYQYDLQEANLNLTATTVPTASNANKGAILTQDSLEVPLEIQFGINNDRANSSRPTLAPLFRLRDVEDKEKTDLSFQLYQELRGSLSPLLQSSLLKDEAKPSFDDRDPDLVVLDAALHFQANLLAVAQMLKAEAVKEEKTTVFSSDSVQFASHVKQGIISYSQTNVKKLDGYLKTIGSNDPSYDLFLRISNQMKEGINLLKTVS